MLLNGCVSLKQSRNLIFSRFFISKNLIEWWEIQEHNNEMIQMRQISTSTGEWERDLCIIIPVWENNNEILSLNELTNRLKKSFLCPQEILHQWQIKKRYSRGRRFERGVSLIGWFKINFLQHFCNSVTKDEKFHHVQ
jgi:hypothetical protein